MMDWSEERWVRLYTRDTADWRVLPWQARALLPLMMRKLDRAGVLETKHGARGVAVLVDLPADVAEVGLAGLLDDGCIAQHERGYVMPNFLPAQEARQSDKLRQQESRTRRRDLALAGHDESQPVTNRDNESRIVTDRHDESHAVTKCHSETRLDKTRREERSHTGPEPEGSGHESGSARQAKPKPPRPEPPAEALELADALRAAVVAAKPNHRVGEEPGWPATRAAWARTLAATLKRRPAAAVSAAIAHLAKTAGEPYAFVVESAKALDEKLDRIEAAMVRASQPASVTPLAPRSRGLTAAEIWAQADELEGLA